MYLPAKASNTSNAAEARITSQCLRSRWMALLMRSLRPPRSGVILKEGAAESAPSFQLIAQDAQDEFLPVEVVRLVVSLRGVLLP